VERPAELEEAVRGALAHSGPALVDCVTNPDEPPMPAKVSHEQALSFARAFLRGEPHRATIASTLFKDKIAELRT
jgi:pyruvate dehydrogenase (quinone)/pyruvate oxidase